MRGKPRDADVLSTTIGRLLRAVPPDQRNGIGKWIDVPARQEVFEYGYDVTMRSLRFSLERLGIDRIDVLYAHDLDVLTHGGKAAMQVRMNGLMAGGYRVLLDLRDQSVIQAFGTGLTE